MSRFHLAGDGPRRCTASERSCPLGGEHFDSLDDASRAFEATMETMGDPHRKVGSTGSEVRIVTTVSPMAGGRYFGCHVPRESVDPLLAAWHDQVGKDKAAHMEGLKAQRDRGYVYHMTVVTPPEMKQAGKLTPFPEDVEITYRGVGVANDGTNEAWFIVCESRALQDWRLANGLDPKDFHVTLGFSPKDVHTMPKGLESINLS